jgi:hypothetical protein
MISVANIADFGLSNSPTIQFIGNPIDLATRSQQPQEQQTPDLAIGFPPRNGCGRIEKFLFQAEGFGGASWKLPSSEPAPVFRPDRAMFPVW